MRIELKRVSADAKNQFDEIKDTIDFLKNNTTEKSQE
jgi:hypothetical protein